MKLALHTWNFEEEFKSGKYSLLDMPALARELGYDALEIMTYNFESFEKAYIDSFRKALNDSNIELAAIDVRNHGFAGDWWEYRNDICIIKLYSHVAHELGCPTLVVFLGIFKEEADRENQLEKDTAGLRECAIYAKKLGVNLALENHRVYGRTCFLEEEAEARDIIKVIKNVDCDNLGSSPDPDNFYYDPLYSLPLEKQEKAYCDYEELLNYALHLHMKVSKFITPEKNLLNDGERLASIIRKSGYDGYMSIELFKPDVDDKIDSLSKAAAFYRAKLKSGRKEL
ncbi:MAG: sugar phosphate isomerase/epimerase [Firmicutes bacterium]|nr:sugar phosphate isomerase/epimerase [Bacillota bacterium]